MIRVIQRAGAILRALGAHPGGRSVGEVATAVCLPRSRLPATQEATTSLFTPDVAPLNGWPRGEYASVVATDIAQIDSEILASRVAILATLGPDGRPQQTPIWFIVEDDRIKMSVSQSRQKYKNLVADGRGTVLIFHPDSEHYYVEIRGDIEVRDDLDFAFADRLGPTKYATDMRSFDSPDARWAMLSLTPTKINVIDVRGAADQALADFPGDGIDR